MDKFPFNSINADNIDDLSGGRIKVAISVENILRLKVPVCYLRVLGLDGESYTPSDYSIISDVVRFRAVTEDGDYFIRLKPSDFVFSVRSEQEINLLFGLQTLMELKHNLRRDLLEPNDFVTIDGLIRTIKAKLPVELLS